MFRLGELLWPKLADYLPMARKVAEARAAIGRWRDDLQSFRSKIDPLPAFSRLPGGERKAFADVVAAMLVQLSVGIGGRTENSGGAISVAREVVEQREATAVFGLFHELGHGVQTDRDVPQSVKDAIYCSSTETGARFGELFADAFAVRALLALSWSPQKILEGAQGALAGHGEDGDHPDWSTREGSIRATIADATGAKT